MPFVYTGKGRKGGTAENGSPPECAAKACAIQWCMAKRDHKEKLCQAFIDDWRTCRDKYMAIHEASKAEELQQQQKENQPSEKLSS